MDFTSAFAEDFASELFIYYYLNPNVLLTLSPKPLKTYISQSCQFIL